ncbi:MAG: restriction endonuclease subunit R, partial [Acidobacteria bacterium]|nr:restriction endonuclease subunit R [Acidobacteriota bacterium]
SGLPEMLLNAELNKAEPLPNEVVNKDRTFHILPYNFAQSGFELKFLQAALEFDELKRRNLEIYFNGEKHLTEFRIDCYARNGGGNWKRVGLYTPDFLLIERRDGKIYRILIIETKGSGFQDQKEFVLRRKFVETEFIKQNNEKFGYAKFHYLFLLDSDGMTKNLADLKDEVRSFFRVE